MINIFNKFKLKKIKSNLCFLKTTSFFQFSSSTPKLNSIEEQQTYFKVLEKKLSIKSLDDWYTITAKNVGSTIYCKYNSMLLLLRNIYPFKIWSPWLFKNFPIGCWNGITGKYNRRQHFDLISKKFNLNYPKDWYKILSKQIYEKELGYFLNDKYGSNLLYCLSDLYPENLWIPWNFSQVPQGYWNSVQNQKSYFNSLKKKLNINTIEDWYKISSKDIGSIYNRYNSTLNMLQNIYPEYVWVPWKFHVTPTRCWSGKMGKYNRRQYFDMVSKLLKLNEPKNWYQITFKEFEEKGYSGLVHEKYRSNLLYCLSDLYPEIYWLPWNFSHVTGAYWTKKENQKVYFEYLEKKLNINKFEDWYKISSKNFGNIYHKYNSMMTMLQNIYPQYIWVPWKFEITQNGCWDGKKGKFNRRQYFDNMLLILNLNLRNSSYFLTVKDIYEKGHSSFLNKKYKSNIIYCLTDLYPEIYWLPWNFSRVPEGYWNKKENILEFLNWCENHFNMKSKEEWYFITTEEIQKLGGHSLTMKWNGINNILLKYFPNQNWNIEKFKNYKIGGKNQFRLFKKIQYLFKEEKNIYENYKHTDLVFNNSKKQIELDIFIPSLNLAFEYQGTQHYQNNDLYRDSKDIKKRDLEKKNLCLNNSITLIEIPFTWDQKLSSLKKIINQIRPDILI